MYVPSVLTAMAKKKKKKKKKKKGIDTDTTISNSISSLLPTYQENTECPSPGKYVIRWK